MYYYLLQAKSSLTTATSSSKAITNVPKSENIRKVDGVDKPLQNFSSKVNGSEVSFWVAFENTLRENKALNNKDITNLISTMRKVSSSLIVFYRFNLWIVF